MDKPGRGRKPILSLQNPTHIASVKSAVKKNAQSIKAMVAELETTLETEMSVNIVKRFKKSWFPLHANPHLAPFTAGGN